MDPKIFNCVEIFYIKQILMIHISMCTTALHAVNELTPMRRTILGKVIDATSRHSILDDAISRHT